MTCVSPKTAGFDRTKTNKFFSGSKKNVTDKINGSRRTIPRAYITKKEPTATNARVVLGADALEGQVQEELIAMKILRKRCTIFAKDKVKQIQFDEAIGEQKMKDVKRWDDIGSVWKKDGGEVNQKRLYHIMHGVFERETMWNGNSWQQCAEEEFMNEQNIKYPSEDVNAAGKNKRKRTLTGIQQIIMNERNESNKLINNRTQKSHRLCITIKRIDGKRRKKDHFTNQYVSHHKMNEREETKSEKLKQFKNESLTIALNEENISALVKAKQKLNSNRANTLTEKVKKKKPKKKKEPKIKKKPKINSRKKGNKRATKKKNNSAESTNIEKPEKKSWMERRREKNSEYHKKIFELSKINTAEGKEGECRRSTTQTKICITKTFFHKPWKN